MDQVRIAIRFVVLVSVIAFTASVHQVGAQATANPARTITVIPVGKFAMRVESASLAERKPRQPIVILESGSISPLENWDPVFDQIAAIGPVLAYDRRGVGHPEFDGEPQTLKHVARSLHGLLAQLKVAPPYVLVGHSYGGVLIRAFAEEFPSEVVGLVYLDTPDIEMTYSEMDAISPDARHVVFGDLEHFPTNMPAGPQAELNNLRQVLGNDMAEARAVHPPAGLVAGVVIAAGQKGDAPPEISAGLLRLQIKHQQEWALATPKGLMVVARQLGHYVQRDDPALTVSVIRYVLGAVASTK